jgi:hypothetical protein
MFPYGTCPLIFPLQTEHLSFKSTVELFATKKLFGNASSTYIPNILLLILIIKSVMSLPVLFVNLKFRWYEYLADLVNAPSILNPDVPV